MFDINELNNEIAVIGSRVNISCLGPRLQSRFVLNHRWRERDSNC